MKLSDATWNLYRNLVRPHTYYVVDSEYTAPSTEDPVRTSRLIAIAIQPIVNGELRKPKTILMNPTVKVSAKTTELTGITTDMVKNKRAFDYYGRQILAALSDPDGVFVAHTSADLRVLRGELERRGLANGQPGLTDLPDLPVIDTSALARLVALPNLPPHKGTISLPDLCALTFVKHDDTKHHQAAYDAKVTALALLELLQHAASVGYASLPDLLADHARGTTRDTPASGTYARTGDVHPLLPSTHLNRHTELSLSPGADDETVRLFLELAAECVTHRCQYLTDEVTDLGPLAVTLLPKKFGAYWTSALHRGRQARCSAPSQPCCPTGCRASNL